MKVMNFLIFSNFSKNISNFFEFILDLFRFLNLKKLLFLARANMAPDAVGAIMCHHVMTYVHAIWHTRMLVFACVCMNVRVCARVCAGMRHYPMIKLHVMT